MGRSTPPLRSAGPARGVLSRVAPDGTTDHRRVLPPRELAPFVAHFWSVAWSLRAPMLAETLPHPSAHVVVERSAKSRAEVTGVCTGRFSRLLAGEGWVFGVKFRPAAFQGLLRAPMASLTDRVVPIAEVLGSHGRTWGRALLETTSLEARVDAACAFLAPRLAPLPADVVRLRDLVERMAVDRALLRVEDVTVVAGVDLRSLQRRFHRYVGVSPKWVIRRYRMHEAAERLRGPDPPALAALAAELGYADQSHFARDFKASIGRTPRAFRPTTPTTPTTTRMPRE
jgi:AraC-like DNA-binding protein